MDNHQQQRAAPARQFSTRFLQSDGIPEYNALLDTHLGKRREFLLGNRHALELMQQTGVIDRVETQPENPNQYVVHIAEKHIHRRKRLPPRSASGPLQLPESQTMPWRQQSGAHGFLAKHTDAGRKNTTNQFLDIDGSCNDVDAVQREKAAMLRGLSRSVSSNTVLATSCKPVLKSASANRLALFGSTKCSALLEASGATEPFSFNKHQASSAVSASHAMEVRQRSRSATSTVSTSVARETKAKGTVPKRPVQSTTTTNTSTVVKGTVEHLLESDAAFMTQIRTMKEQLAQLEKAKAYLDSEIGLLRRKLCGVNAVHENDVAVAHCSSIMQHRLSKAEEEFMKLVTQQQEMKKDVDRVRRELLSLRKVRHKLQEDIEEVAQANQTYEEKIYASKTVRNQLSEELSELERSAEVELEEQRLNLPPEDAVVVDVAKLMGAVQERNSARRGAAFGFSETGNSNGVLKVLNQLNTMPASTSKDKVLKNINGRRSGTDRPKKLDYCTAFHVLQNSLGFSDLHTFEEQFTTTEEQLLSKYKANLALADEVAALERELFTMYTEKKINRENARGIMQANERMERAMLIKVQATQASIRSYNDLREQRNQEHAKLRAIMVRCLDALQIDVGPEINGIGMSGNRTPSSRRSSNRNWAEASSPELLETLQRKMTQVAVTLKVKHSARIHEIPPEALRLNRGHDGRRSNMFSARETSKIVLGPREPSGSALAAILGTVQPPSVENAIALTENASMMEVMHGLHRAVSPARRKASSLSIIPPEMGRMDAPHGSTVGNGSSTVVNDSSVHTISEGTEHVRRCQPSILPPMQGLSSRPSLAAMIEADKEEDKDDNDNDNDDDEEEELQDNDDDEELQDDDVETEEIEVNNNDEDDDN